MGGAWGFGLTGFGFSRGLKVWLAVGGEVGGVGGGWWGVWGWWGCGGFSATALLGNAFCNRLCAWNAQVRPSISYMYIHIVRAPPLPPTAGPKGLVIGGCQDAQNHVICVVLGSWDAEKRVICMFLVIGMPGHRATGPWDVHWSGPEAGFWLFALSSVVMEGIDFKHVGPNLRNSPPKLPQACGQT